MKKKTKGVILKQKGTRRAEDGEDWNGFEMTILKSLAVFQNTRFSKHPNGDVASLTDTTTRKQHKFWQIVTYFK